MEYDEINAMMDEIMDHINNDEDYAMEYPAVHDLHGHVQLQHDPELPDLYALHTATDQDTTRNRTR